MTLRAALREECVAVGDRLPDKTAVLREIARLAKRCSLLDGIEEEYIFRRLEEREALGSTGFGHGIALPHCRIEGIDEFIVGLLSLPDGAPFKTLDGRKARFFVFILAPQDYEETHIQILAGVSDVLKDAAVVKELLSKATPESLRASFIRHMPADVR